MTEKNMFVYKLVCNEVFQILVIFYVKLATLPEKSQPLFPSNPPFKIEILSRNLFLKIQ